MRALLSSFAALMVTVPAIAQQSDVRPDLERISTSFVDNYDRQNASGIAGLFARDGLLVNVSGEHPQAELESFYNDQFKAGFTHLESHVDQASLIAPDVAIGVGQFSLSGKKPDGTPLQTSGRWTATYMREGGTFKVRILTAFPHQGQQPASPAR
jgi:ketosteroid isomerase-like protein